MLRPFQFAKVSSLCVQCQYRLAVARRGCQGTLVRGLGQSRHSSHGQRHAQEHASNDNSNPNIRFEVDAPNATDHDLKPGLQYAERRVRLHRKDALGVDSLGRPAEVLVLTAPGQEREDTLHVDRLDQQNKDPAPGSADEMLEKIKEEQGIPSERGIARNLEELRETWVSKRKWKGRPPSPKEFENLAGKLEAGFTVKQLMGYYVQAGSKVEVDPSDLDQPYATDLYTRSAWTLGTTPFPGDPTSRLKVCNSTAQNLGFTEAVIDAGSGRILTPILKALASKRAVIERILRECWQLTMARDEEAVGELEVWTQSERNHLLLNHDRDILRRVSERYGAKIDTSRSHNVIRITADRGTCDDVLNLLVYVFRSIERAEVGLPPAPGGARRLSDRLGAADDPKYREEIQQLTNTIIRPTISGEGIGSQFSRHKVIIYYLGPSKDDLVDARRLLSQSSRPMTDDSSVHLGDPTDNVAIVPLPVDVGNGLPLVHRTQRWSRWVSQTERKSPNSYRPLFDVRRSQKIALQTARKAYRTQGILGSLTADVSDADLHCWPDATSQTSSLTLGHLLYPANIVKNLNVATRGSSEKQFSSPFLRTLRSSRQFLMSNTGLKPPRDMESGDKLRHKEDLRVLLTAKALNTSSPEQADSKPNLEILVTIDREEKATRLASVRLIFASRHSDLILPSQPVDLRFSTEQHAIADPSIVLLPAIQTFVASSNFDVWGTNRLKTPSGLTLPIPQYSTEGYSQKSANNKIGQRVRSSEHTEYEFASLEHRARLVECRGNLDIVYTVIEAGRTGGRAEGIQICTKSPLTDNVGSAMTLIANSLIEEFISERLFNDSDVNVNTDIIPYPRQQGSQSAEPA